MYNNLKQIKTIIIIISAPIMYFAKKYRTTAFVRANCTNEQNVSI